MAEDTEAAETTRVVDAPAEDVKEEEEWRVQAEAFKTEGACRVSNRRFAIECTACLAGDVRRVTLVAEVLGTSRALLFPGNEAFKTGKWKDAIEGYTKAIDIDPDNKVLYEYLSHRINPLAASSPSRGSKPDSLATRRVKGPVRQHVYSGSFDPILLQSVKLLCEYVRTFSVQCGPMSRRPPPPPPKTVECAPT